jgi:hypothetical protein
MVAHRPQHKKECKQHEAEIVDLDEKELFKQPPTKEDCPICLQILPQSKRGGHWSRIYDLLRENHLKRMLFSA